MVVMAVLSRDVWVSCFTCLEVVGVDWVGTINIATKSSGSIPIQVLIVPKIATPIQSKVRAPIKDLPYLRQLKLAHPVTSDKNFDISLLISADHYWDFVEEHIIRGNGPTAIQSKLGYLLSGMMTVATISVERQSSSIAFELFYLPETYQINRTKIKPQSGIDTDLRNNYQ
jgi:hypothetical protein